MKIIKLLLLLVIIIVIIPSCKKGDNDPFLSLRSRKARITGEWKLITGTTIYTFNDTTESVTYYENKVDVVYSTTDAGTIASGTYSYTEKWNINKDYTFKITQNFFDYRKEISGYWSFYNKDKNLELKNKEAIIFRILSEKIIYTTKASPPITKIITPVKNDTILALNTISDWWTGIKLTFTASDQTINGAIDSYAWSVDGGSWHWSSDTTMTITPDNFSLPITGKHYIKVISRNNTNLVDPIGDSAAIYLVMPSFEKKVLIIDETDEFNFPFVTYNISDATIDNFYSRVFPDADQWDYKANNGMPSRATLSKYKLVVWHADDWPQSNPHKISDPKHIEIFTDYLKVGGKFLMSGWGILKSFAYNSNFPYSFPPGSFVYDYLHIRTVAVTDLIGDCTGGESTMTSFSSFRVDSLKLAFFPFNGKLGQVNLIISPAGFTVSLFTYTNSPTSSYVTYRGRTIALRYYGTTFDAIVLGFPLYFINEEDATVMGKQIIRNLNIE